MNDSENLHTCIRREFPFTAKYSYLNSATAGLVPMRTVRAMTNYWQRAAAPKGRDNNGPEQREDDARGRAARLMGASRKEVNFVSSTTHGLAIAATSLPLGPGDEVLIPQMEFPSVVYPFLNDADRRGFQVRLLDWEGHGPGLDLIESALSSRTRALCISWVQYQNGYTHDLDALGRLCRDRGIFLVVDAIQGLGAIPLDLEDVHVDVLASGTFKWLMSGTGMGILYVREELIEQLCPALAGYTAVKTGVEDPDYRLEFRSDIERFNLGSPNEPGKTALYHSLGLIGQIGVDRINARARRIARRIRVGAREKGYTLNTPEEELSPIVALTTGDHSSDAELLARLKAGGVCTCIRGMGLRISPHFYCTGDDAEKLLSLL